MSKKILVTAISGLLCLAPLVHAGQHPDAQQRVALDAALTRAGFVSWGEIEMERGYWDVDDARKELGARQKYDLKLDPATLQVIEEKLDD